MAALALLTAATPALAQTAAPTPPVTGAIAMPGVVEPEAAAALDRMGAYLRTLRNFEVRSDGTIETVFDNGQKLTYTLRSDYVVGMPDRMTLTAMTDRGLRRFYYDGKELTVAVPRVNRYTVIPVVGTVSELLDRGREDFGIEFPLQDLFRWGTPAAATQRPTSGFRVGDAMVGDEPVDHYAFRQDGIDYQVWVAKGDRPLPRRLVITNTAHPAQPAFQSTISWNLAPQIGADSFTFRPTASDERVDFVYEPTAPAATRR
jgi:hypothetical protein